MNSTLVSRNVFLCAAAIFIASCGTATFTKTGSDATIESLRNFELAFIDELHRHRDLSLQRTWVGKIGKVKGAQVVVISTAGEPGGEFELARERIRQTAAHECL